MNERSITYLTCYSLNVPPTSGGQIRTYNVLKHLSLDVEVKFVVYNVSTRRFERSFIQKNITRFGIPTQKIILFLNKVLALLNRQIDFGVILISLLWHFDEMFKHTLSEVAESSTVLICDFPYLFGALSRWKGCKTLIYHTHDFVYQIQSQILPKSLIGRLVTQWIKHLEKRACQDADFITVCTEEDKESICHLYEIKSSKVYIVPNAADTKQIKPKRFYEKTSKTIACGK